ncbi:hypothetical protein O181_125285 [Austropuccinia psidii MF-1]|uniref:Uncharacterized protein n=1 Tax=Austropuccinia psidii MF-1 TaxID=1389203 RepID=A0A9Q3KPE1_9BASI|nr:hypothetical protein [Austropuccinia psidii MF-1]
MRQEYGKHDWLWCKSEIITKWANNSWRFEMEDAFESTIFNSDKEKPLTWSLKQKDRLPALHPGMSDSIINMKISIKCGGELENAIRCRCVEPFSTEDYINEMEDIITKKIICKSWTRNPVESKIVPETSREDIRPERPVQYSEKKEGSEKDSEISEDTPTEDYPIENITAFFEVTEVHEPFPQYSEDCYNLFNVQEARICKTQTSRGKGYTAGISFITEILMNDVEAKVNLDTGAFFTCVGKDYLEIILPEWMNHPLPIESLQFSSSSNNMYPLSISDNNLLFPHPSGSENEDRDSSNGQLYIPTYFPCK